MTAYDDRQFNVNMLIDLLRDFDENATDKQLEAIHTRLIHAVVKIIVIDRPNMTSENLDALFARAQMLTNP
jgi:hypothetical protein